MTLDELREIAKGQEYVYLTLPRKVLPRGDKTRLLGHTGPLGRICTVKEADTGYKVVAVFECRKILDWLEAYGELDEDPTRH